MSKKQERKELNIAEFANNEYIHMLERKHRMQRKEKFIITIIGIIFAIILGLNAIFGLEVDTTLREDEIIVHGIYKRK